MYKQYREKNDSTILVTTKGKQKPYIKNRRIYKRKRINIYERSKHTNRKDFGGRERESGNEKKYKIKGNQTLYKQATDNVLQKQEPLHCCIELNRTDAADDKT
jgi:hypothetical protein